MKKVFNKKYKVMNIFLTAIVILLLNSCSTDETQTVTTLWDLTMSDEFMYSGAPDNEIWDYNIGTGSNGWGNNELQYYTDRRENVVVEDGVLKIIARQEQFEGSGYTSARLVTKGKFEQQYGRFEARMKLPWGQGLWPAFWLLGNDIDAVGWPQCGEIDIMENRGQEPTLINGTLHGPGYSAGESVGKGFDLGNDRFDTGFPQKDFSLTEINKPKILDATLL